MKEEMFHELLESVQQAGAIMRGEMEPAGDLWLKNPTLNRSDPSWGLPNPTLQLCLGSGPHVGELGTKASNAQRPSQSIA